MSIIYWAADSTVQYNDITTYPQTGMGQTLGLYLKPEVTVCNHAKNGRSTKSFLEEGLFDAFKDKMKEGDFLFIQFGHNDEKIEDPSRYTTPNGTYQENLRIFINAAREKKAYPVLISSLERRLFDEDGVLKDTTHREYVDAMETLAEKEKVPFIHLQEKSHNLIASVGDETSKKWFMHLPKGVYAQYPEGREDNTHLKYEGAVTFAGLVAEGLRELGGIYAELLL